MSGGEAPDTSSTAGVGRGAGERPARGASGAEGGSPTVWGASALPGWGAEGSDMLRSAR